MDRPTASPVPVWLFNEQEARAAFDDLWDTLRPAARDAARRRFHASFWRLS